MSLGVQSVLIILVIFSTGVAYFFVWDRFPSIFLLTDNEERTRLSNVISDVFVFNISKIGTTNGIFSKVSNLSRIIPKGNIFDRVDT